MSPAVVAGIVVAVVLVALALQVLARQIQRLPLDQRRADPLIDISSVSSGATRPAELHQLTTMVANAMLSDASFRNELGPLVDELRADRPNGTTPPAGRRPGGRSRRSDRIETIISDLEAHWGLADPDPTARDRRRR